MKRRKAQAQPMSAEQTASRRHRAIRIQAGRSTGRAIKRRSALRKAVDAEVGQLHKTHALLIATQFAANHDCDFDVSDALAVIRDRVGQAIERLDRGELDS